LTNTDYLALQIVIVCVLLFLVATMVVHEYPELFR